MKVTLLTIILVSTAHSFQIQGLGYSNVDAGNMTKEEIDAAARVIPQASRIHGKNLEENIKYIQAQMDFEFGSRTFTYVVSIQDKSSSSELYIKEMFNHWVSRKDISPENPDWTYLIYMSKKTQDTTKLIGPSGRGSGISDQTKEAIQSTVSSLEKEGKCNFSSILSMSKQLEFLTGQSWNIFCWTTDTYFYGGIRDDKWAVVSTDCCKYTVLSI